MAYAVVSGEGCDLSGLVSELRSELQLVRRELSSVVAENLKMKEVIEKIQSGGVHSCVGAGEWKVVQSKGHSMKLSRKASSGDRVPCRNSFSVLEDECGTGKTDDVCQSSGKSFKIVGGKSQPLVLVGDSLCRHVSKKVRHRVRGNYFFPGAGIKKVGESVERWIDGNDVVCLVAGGNDIQDGRSEELIRLYRQALERVRKKGAIAVMCGILPRLGHGSEWSSRAIGINARMEAFCRENSIVFIEAWDSFYGRRQLFARDGVHLSGAGNSVLAGLIDRAVEGFC